MKRSIYPVVFLVISVVLFCNYPQDPTKNPVNAKAKFEQVNDEPPVVPIKVVTNDSVKISFYFFLEHFIDSIEIGIYSTESNEKSDTVFCFKPPFSVEDNIVYIFFPKAGNKRCILTAVKTGGSRMSDTLIFEVIQKNRAPVWSLDTIPVVSKKGVKEECDLNEFVNDPDDDPVVIENQGSLPDGFSFSSGVLSNEIATDSGLYFFEILASDDSLSSAVVVRWEILPDSGKKDNDQFPFFVDPVEMVEIDEGQTAKVVFRAQDPDGLPVQLSIHDMPEWISAQETEDSIEVEISPDYSVVSSRADTAHFEFEILGVCDTSTIRHRVLVIVKGIDQALPHFVDPVETIEIDEGQTAKVVFHARDPGGLPVQLSIHDMPEWISAQETEDSIEVEISPDYSVVSSQTDTAHFDFEIQGVCDTSTIRHEVLVIVKDIDKALPHFIDPLEMVEIDEGKTKKQMFYAEHPIEEQVEISHVSKPDWVSIAGTMDSIELSISPGYEVASASISSVQAKVVLKASGSGLDVEHELIIQVKNVNRAPEFISFPDDISSRMGELFESSQIEITDDDGDEVSVELVSSPDNMEMGKDNKIRWFVPRIGYMPGNQVTVTVCISDNDTSVENSFILTIDPHKWLLVNNEGIEIRGEMAAAGKDTLFYTASGANPSIYRSIDGGENWENLPYVNFGSMYSYAVITKMVIRGSTVFVSGPSSSGNYLSGFYATFPVDNPLDTSIVRTGHTNSFDVSPDGKRIVSQHDFLENYKEKPYFYYKDEGLVRSKDSIFGQIPAIASGNSNIWAYIDSSNYLFLMTAYNYEESDSLGFKYHAYVADSVTGVYIGDENGDTAFVIFDDSKKIMCSYSGGGYKTINLDPEITPAALCLVSGSVGWVLDKEGDVWYSNNSFKEIAREILEDSRGNKAKITGIFKSSDGETVFAYSRDANNIVKIYRY